MQVRLHIAHNNANVRQVVLEGDALVGRGAECDLRIAAGTVSRRHCQIKIGESGVFVHDFGSSNGTFINGKRLQPAQDIPLPSGSRLTIGRIQVVVEHEDPSAKAADVPVHDTDHGTGVADTIAEGKSEEARHTDVEPTAEPFTGDDVEVKVPDDEQTSSNSSTQIAYSEPAGENAIQGESADEGDISPADSALGDFFQELDESR